MIDVEQRRKRNAAFRERNRDRINEQQKARNALIKHQLNTTDGTPVLLKSLPRNFAVRKTTHTPIFEPHPPNYNGYEGVCVIEFNVSSSTTKDEDGIPLRATTTHIIAVADNINIDYGNVSISYLDLDRVKPQVAHEILSNWDMTIPISFFVAINNFNVPAEAWGSISVQGIRRIIGPVHYFDMNPFSVKRRKRIISDQQ